MADLNALLRWGIENSVPPTTPSNQPPLSLTFRPAADGPHSTAPHAALHPNDPQFQPKPSSSGDEAAVVSEPVKPAHRSDLTSEMLDVIMGKSDAVIMKEKMAIAVDQEQDVDERLLALDDMEMLVESIDNANNLRPTKLWDPLLSLFSDPVDSIVCRSCWVCGTAIQNNIKAQTEFFGLTPSPLPQIFSIISSHNPTTSSSTRAKAVYCLSAALKHWPEAITTLSSDSGRGWAVLREGLKDPEAVIRRKIAFLVHTLILQSDDVYTKESDTQLERAAADAAEKGENFMIGAMKEHGVIQGLMEALSAPVPTGPDGENAEMDWDFSEKVVRGLISASERGGLDGGQKEVLKGIWEEWGRKGMWEDLGFSETEGKEMRL